LTVWLCDDRHDVESSVTKILDEGSGTVKHPGMRG
jgi:hypothetical protein